MRAVSTQRRSRRPQTPRCSETDDAGRGHTHAFWAGDQRPLLPPPLTTAGGALAPASNTR